MGAAVVAVVVQRPASRRNKALALKMCRFLEQPQRWDATLQTLAGEHEDHDSVWLRRRLVFQFLDWRASEGLADTFSAAHLLCCAWRSLPRHGRMAVMCRLVMAALGSRHVLAMPGAGAANKRRRLRIGFGGACRWRGARLSHGSITVSQQEAHACGDAHSKRSELVRNICSMLSQNRGTLRQMVGAHPCVFRKDCCFARPRGATPDHRTRHHQAPSSTPTHRLGHKAAHPPNSVGWVLGVV